MATLDDEWTKLSTKKDFYEPEEFAIRKQYISDLVDKYGWSAELPEDFSYPKAEAVQVSEAPPTEQKKAEAAVENMVKARQEAVKARAEAEPAPAPAAVVADTAIDATAAVEKAPEESANQKLSKGQKKRMKEKKKKEKSNQESANSTDGTQEVASETAAADKEMPEGIFIAQEGDDRSQELAALMKKVWYDVNPDQLQAQAEAAAGQGAEVAQGAEAGMPAFKAGFLDGKSKGKKGKKKEKQSAAKEATLKVEGSGAPIGVDEALVVQQKQQAADSGYAERTMDDFLQGVMTEMAADSFWKDLMYPLKAAREALLQHGSTPETRTQAAELIRETKDQCEAIYLFQDEQRILGAIIRLLETRQDAGLDTLVSAADLRGVRVSASMNEMTRR